jgi:Fe-S-cluster containining protein
MATRRPQIRLLEETEDAPSVVGLELLRAELPFMGERLELRVEVPDRRATLAEVVPLARAICDRFTEAAVRCVAKAGRRISCTKGCGVCCTNYLVPMTVPEAFRLLADLRAAAPGERRRLEAAFDAAEETLAASGLLEACRNLDPGDPASGVAQRELAGKWWSERRFPCPLLRDQACSHYASRPIPCREFLVVSPPQRCESNAETRVRRPFSMHAVLSQWAAELEGTRPTLVLLVNFLSWCMQRAERGRRTWRGPQIVRKLLEILTDTAAAADETYRGPVADDREPAAGG